MLCSFLLDLYFELTDTEFRINQSIYSLGSMPISAVYTISVALLLVFLVTITFHHFIDSPAKFASDSSGILRFYGRHGSSLPNVQLESNLAADDRGILRAHLLSGGSKPKTASAAEQSSISRNVNRTRITRKGDVVAEGLARARAAIRWGKPVPHINRTVTSIYRNPDMFFRSYREMEKRFKVYVYSEGEVPIVHFGPCKDIYTIEGRFIQEMENGGSKMRTLDPHKAHAFFLPFSVVMMVTYLYKPMTYDLSPLTDFISDYVGLISRTHPFWNSSNGADHFMLACHDWGPLASQPHHNLMRVLCNANSSEGFNPMKDVSLPEINLVSGNIDPTLLSVQTRPHRTRPHLAFFAGGLHGPVRPALLSHWKDKDPLLLVNDYLPKGVDYYQLMTRSRFCLCPSGYEVASPRIVEAIYAECVPVVISKNYVLPFSDVLRWEAFSLQVDVDHIPQLKDILMAVSDDQYSSLIQGVRAVRKHFVINSPAKRFDVFHMILHSIWLRRLNLNIT